MKRSQLYIVGLLTLCVVSAGAVPQNSDVQPLVLDDSIPAYGDVVTDSIAVDPIVRNPITIDSVARDSVEVDSVMSGYIDTLGIDTMTVDSLAVDTVGLIRHIPIMEDSVRPSRIRRVKVDLDNPVIFSSQDSMVMIGRDTTYMYGDGKVNYGDIKLNADQIEMDMRTNIVYAVGRPDTAGEIVGKPVFEEKGSTYESKTMRYNFETKRGYIKDVITQQGEGYLTGGITKKTEDDEY